MYLDVKKLREMGIDKRAKVCLDGRELYGCIEADTDKGYAITMHPEDVMPGMDDIPTRKHHGNITIEVFGQ